MTTLSRASLILDAIAESRGPLTLTELAARTGLPRSSVHRTVQDLETELYLVRLPNRPGYALGPGLLKFGLAGHLQLLSTNRARLAALARETNENVELAIFSGREVVVVDQVASPERLKGVTQVGKSFSLHASCIGKALLAFLPLDRVQQLLPAQLEHFTEATTTDREALLAELETVRSTRIAVDVEEHNVGICAMATAQIGPTGALQAVAVVVPTRRFVAKRTVILQGLQRLNSAVELSGALEQVEFRRRAALG